MSVTGRNTSDVPRSTTPSSVTSSSSRTKSPATPATRNSSRLTRQGMSCKILTMVQFIYVNIYRRVGKKD